jgi:nucleoside-diphosphate-sugar epimerase
LSALKVLFVGGTGIISSACAELAVERGMELYLLTRGSSIRTPPAGARLLIADVNNPEQVRSVLGGLRFDVVVDWVAFTPADIARDGELFWDITDQYIFISSASAYQTPPASLPITELTPLSNPFWEYSRQKIACEKRLFDEYFEADLPITIVRPSHTYDETMVPFDGGWTVMERMRSGKPVVIPGDGTSLWTITHSRDFAVGFVGLFGNPRAIGHAFHITSDEPMTWNQIYTAMADAAGVQAQFVHIASEAIAEVDQEWGAALLGDKSHSMIFDNTKVKRLVPEFAPQVSFVEGAREIVAWHDADSTRRQVNARLDARMDALVERYRPRALQSAASIH